MKVLILAYEFPPFTSIAVQRPYSWFRYFGQSGISTTVVTRQWSGTDFSQESFIQPSPSAEVLFEKTEYGEIIRAPFFPNWRDRLLLKYGYQRWGMLRKLLSMMYLATEHFIDRMDRDFPIYLAARKHLQQNKPDILIATGGPFILFKYVLRLSREFNIPYAIDYRDGWYTHETFEHNDPLTKLLYRTLLLPRERTYVNNAALITVASPSYIEKLNQIHPRATFQTIYNGFIPDRFKGLEAVPQINNCFTITYAGTLYPFQRIDVFVNGLKMFLEQNPGAKIRVIFYGTRFYQDQYLRLLKETEGLEQVVEVTERMSHEAVLKHMKESHLLLLLANRNNCLLASKIYDYLAVGRKILLVENDHGVLHEIITKTTSGIGCDNAIEVNRELNSAYREFLDTGRVNSSTQNIEFFDRFNQASIYAGLLRQTCQANLSTPKAS